MSTWCRWASSSDAEVNCLQYVAASLLNPYAGLGFISAYNRLDYAHHRGAAPVPSRAKTISACQSYRSYASRSTAANLSSVHTSWSNNSCITLRFAKMPAVITGTSVRGWLTFHQLVKTSLSTRTNSARSSFSMPARRSFLRKGSAGGGTIRYMLTRDRGLVRDHRWAAAMIWSE